MRKSIKNYNKDYYGWVSSQADFLKKKNFENLDLIHLIDEVISLGNTERNKLESYLENLLLHMLKCRYQPDMKTRSWDLSIREANFRIAKLIHKNPSLKPELKEIFEDSYFVARLEALKETKLDAEILPEENPWTLGNIMPYLEKKYF